MSAAHTPGPWKLSTPQKDWNGDYTLFEIHWSDAGECIAEFVHGEADARLIAAAPELLTQLEYAVKLLGAFPALNGTAQVQSMRAAIAKALGRTPNEIGDEG